MEHDPLDYPYPSRRMMKFGKNGMVGTSQPQAAQAGLEILKKGGNAVDAAVATAASLTVLEPTSNGIGGDGFAMVWKDGELHGLNASGPSPSSISRDKINEDEMPKVGWEPVTVPGVTAGWAELWREFGSLEFEKLLKPAVRYASEGFPVSPIAGRSWKAGYQAYKELDDEVFQHWFDTFAPNGRAPEIGEIWKSEGHAETLRKIAETEADSFYSGELADRIVEFSKETGGYMSKKDLHSFSPEWVDPLKVDYRGYDVWELPPNGQGMVALIALNILKDFDFDVRDSVDTFHKQIEAIKLAFADGRKNITDPDFMNIDPETLLSKDYAEKRRKKIEKEAIEPDPGHPRDSGTVYLATADEDMMVSYIQSNYMGFGSGLVVPGTGIALQNRGYSFSLDPGHANSLEPNKRPYHTIIPGFLSKNDRPIGPFGVMGGYMQPQGHLQVLMNSIDFDHNPQAALDAPRWRWIDDKKVKLEHGVPEHIAKGLSRRGHDVDYSVRSTGFGRGQIIWKKGEVLEGGTEPRTDGQILGY